MKHQWLDQQKRFVYQEWNSATKKVEPSATAKSLTVEEATELINQVAELCLPDLVTRFCPQRRPKQEPQEGEQGSVPHRSSHERPEGKHPASKIATVGQLRSLECDGGATSAAKPAAPRPGNGIAKGAGKHLSAAGCTRPPAGVPSTHATSTPS